MASFQIFLAGDKECVRRIFNRFVGKELDFSQTGIRKNTIRREFDGEVVSVSVNNVFSGLDLLPYLPFDGVIIAYDVSKFTPESLMSVVNEKGDVSRYPGEIMLVGNNRDLTDEKPHKDVFSEYTYNRVLKSFEVNLVTGINVEKVLYTLIKDLKSKPEKSNAVPKDGFLQRMLSRALSWAFSAAPEEITQDPYTLNLYEKAIKEGTEIDRSIRINVVGNYGQGKTTLVKRLLNKGISGVKSTNGIDVQKFTCCRSETGKLTYRQEKEIKEEDIVNRLLTVNIGEEPPPNLPSTSGHNENLSHYVPVSQTHLQTMETQATATPNNPQPDTHFPRSVLAPKFKTLFEREKKKEKGARNNNETSFTFWDFGGQFVFYATHSMFHSRKAIYLLVFDLSLPFTQFGAEEEDFPLQSVRRNAEYYLRFWMNSIHSFVGTDDGIEPVVILVGTHKDKIPGKPSARNKFIEKCFDDVRDLFDNTILLKHIHKEDFAIDNNDPNDGRLVALREAIIKLGEERASEEEIPAKWIQLEKALDEIKDRKIVTIQTVLDNDGSAEFPIRDIKGIKLFLQYHHEKGTLVYFDESPISDFVILDPQFLIDAFKCFFTGQQFIKKDPKLRSMWNMLVSEARLEDSLIDYQWGIDEMFKENKRALLGFLEKHRIIAQAHVFDDSTCESLGLGWYIVPFLLTDNTFHTDIQRFVHGKPMSKLQFVMKFPDSTIVELIFHRLLAALAGKWPIVKTVFSQRSQVMIYKNACVVQFHNHAGIVELNYDAIHLAVVSCCPSVNVLVERKEADLFRRFCESVVLHEFRKSKAIEDSRPKLYIVRFACNHKDHEGRGSINYLSQDASKTIPCPDFYSHDIVVETDKSEWFTDGVSNDVELNDEQLSRISMYIGKNWEFLGIQFGLTQVEIDHIKADYRCSEKTQIYHMLRTLRSNRCMLTLESLMTALRSTSDVTVHWDGIRNVADGI